MPATSRILISALKDKGGLFLDPARVLRRETERSPPDGDNFCAIIDTSFLTAGCGVPKKGEVHLKAHLPDLVAPAFPTRALPESRGVGRLQQAAARGTTMCCPSLGR